MQIFYALARGLDFYLKYFSKIIENIKSFHSLKFM